jgi:hypothetical protein
VRRCLRWFPPPPSIRARLGRGGYLVTDRADGLYDVASYGVACSAEEVLDLWCWMEIWPSCSAVSRAPLGPQVLCGG